MKMLCRRAFLCLCADCCAADSIYLWGKLQTQQLLAQSALIDRGSVKHGKYTNAPASINDDVRPGVSRELRANFAGLAQASPSAMKFWKRVEYCSGSTTEKFCAPTFSPCLAAL
mmetsp:Transcript_28579/g.55302  ORF Transcript_28579/g.55302 Transcript_28579/m.55302 type:complete len:114 (+) Transcript_28579:78-419(+)